MATRINESLRSKPFECEALALAKMNRSIKRKYDALGKITERFGGCSILNRGYDII